MKESKWSDEQLQELLSQLPKIKDDRDPRDIYQAIEIKMGKQKKQNMDPAIYRSGCCIAPAFYSRPKPYELAGVCR